MYIGLQQEDDQKSTVQAKATKEQEACNSEAITQRLG